MKSSIIIYHEFTPHPLLKDYIKTYWYFKDEPARSPCYEIMPDGYFDLLIYFKDGKISGTNLTGIWNRMITTGYNLPETIGIRFTPLAVKSLLNIRINELLNKSDSIVLNDWNLNQDIIEESYDNSLSCIINYLNRCFLTMLQQETVDVKIKKLFDLIDKSSGTLPIHIIADRIGLSTRQLQRKVNDLIGIGAKDYAKIVRFRKSLRMIKDDKLNFVGYFDQAHFIKDFKSYTGFTPNSVDLKNDVRFLQYYDSEE